VEPKTSSLPIVASTDDASPQGGRLLVASRLATSLSLAHTIEEIAGEAVLLLHESFDYYLAVVQRLDPDGYLRVVAGAGPLAEGVADFLAQEQPVEIGVNGRVARTGRAAMVNDTALDSDYLTRNPRTDPAPSSRCRSSSPARPGA
jgi:GAF domain-containing protein